MSLSVKLHEAITNYNVLQQPTEELKDYFSYHPKAFKTALLANHLFRAAAMAGFMMVLPLAVGLPICILGSLFYRLTVEDNCAYKFALPALAGGCAFLIAKGALISLISGVAWATLASLAAALMALVPLALYLGYVILTVRYDVDNRPCPSCVTPDLKYK